MSYTKTDWTNNSGAEVVATNLNKIEQGIYDNDAKITNLQGSSMPIGSGCDYYGSSLPNSNFMWADGSAISRTTYSELFAIIGTTYGAGNGTTTFNLPDKRTRVTVMRKSDDDTFATLGGTGGEKKHTLTTSEMPSHSHPFTSRIDWSNSPNTTNTLTVNGVAANISAVSGNAGVDRQEGRTTQNSGSGNAHNVLQPYLVCNYIIKVK